MFAAPFSYTLRGMTKLMEWRAPAEHDPRALFHKDAPRKADTKSIGHILCSDEQPRLHCLSLSGQKS